MIEKIKKILIQVFSFIYVIIGIFMCIYLLFIIFRIISGIVSNVNYNVETEVFSFLSTIILIIVGVELGELVVARDYKLLIDILMFAIARKILIRPEFTLEYSIGYLAIIVFVLMRKYVFE